MPINQWPEHERPRERLLKHGALPLSDAELLSIIIGSGSKHASAMELARELLLHFGSLRGLKLLALSNLTE